MAGRTRLPAARLTCGSPPTNSARAALARCSTEALSVVPMCCREPHQHRCDASLWDTPSALPLPEALTPGQRRRISRRQSKPQQVEQRCTLSRSTSASNPRHPSGRRDLAARATWRPNHSFATLARSRLTVASELPRGLDAPASGWTGRPQATRPPGHHSGESSPTMISLCNASAHGHDQPQARDRERRHCASDHHETLGRAWQNAHTMRSRRAAP